MEVGFRVPRVELRAAQYWTRGRHTGFGQLNGGVSPGSQLPLYDRFRLGGFFSLSGFHPVFLSVPYT